MAADRRSSKKVQISLFSTNTCWSAIQPCPLFALHAEDQNPGIQEAGFQTPDPDFIGPPGLKESYMTRSRVVPAAAERGHPKPVPGLREII